MQGLQHTLQNTNTSLPVTQNRYLNYEHLYSTMTTFGTYRLSYEPPAGSMDASIYMSISAEANLSDMLSFFETFLRAATYPLGQDHELGIERKAPDFGNASDFWEEDNFVFTKDTVIQGASGTDTLSLGDARAAVHFESGAKSWEDVISFG